MSKLMRHKDPYSKNISCYFRTAPMYAYLTIVRTFFDEYLVYRVNFLLWRFRVVINLLIIYFVWSAFYLSQKNIFGYDRVMMLTYILLVNFFSDLTFSSKVQEISGEIIDGTIMQRILRPFPYFGYLLAKEWTDKMVNLSCSLIEITFLILVLQPKLSPLHDITSLLVGLAFLFSGIVISFFISFCLAMISFWSPEVWAPRFIYISLSMILTGLYFPLDIISPHLYTLLLWTPFPYFVFLPAQIILKGIPDRIGVYALGSGMWLIIMYIFARWLWNKGMRDYSFYGR